MRPHVLRPRGRTLHAGSVRGFNGYDALVLWHAYPRIGFDDRNQFDFYRDMPGGLDALRDLARRLRAVGVRVFIDYNPWDTGTRREGASDVDALAAMVGAVEADGVFLDTLHHGSGDLRPRLDAVRPGVVLESELDLPVRSRRSTRRSSCGCGRAWTVAARSGSAASWTWRTDGGQAPENRPGRAAETIVRGL